MGWQFATPPLYPKTCLLYTSIAEYQEKLKALEAQKTEAENLEIVQMVRALRMTPAQLSAMLSGGTVPGSMVDDLSLIHI